MNYLAIDLGDKRTGIAVGDDELKLVHPITVLEIPIGDLLLDAIVKLVEEHGANELVLGLPVNMDGSVGQRAKLTKTFGITLQELTTLHVHYQDERLTSAAAEERLHQSGKTYQQKKNIRDAIAAAEILTDFLQANQSSS